MILLVFTPSQYHDGITGSGKGLHFNGLRVYFQNFKMLSLACPEWEHLMVMFPDHEVFDTPKPELLLERIIHIATNPGELVVDIFGGSGTTAAVAHKMRRRWVALP